MLPKIERKFINGEWYVVLDTKRFLVGGAENTDLVDYVIKKLQTLTTGKFGYYANSACIGIDINDIIATLKTNYINNPAIDILFLYSQYWHMVYNNSDLAATMNFFTGLGVTPTVTYTWGELYEVILCKDIPDTRIPLLGFNRINTNFKYDLTGKIIDIGFWD